MTIEAKDPEWMLIAACSVLAALITYMASCGTARAAPHTIQFRNPDPTRSYTALRTPWGTVAATCAPGATCSVVVDIPPGYQTVTAEATDGTLWSSTSNALTPLIQPTPAECQAIPHCPADLDRSGSVNGADFTVFVRSFNRSWAAPPAP